LKLLDSLDKAKARGGTGVGFLDLQKKIAERIDTLFLDGQVDASEAIMVTTYLRAEAESVGGGPQGQVQGRVEPAQTPPGPDQGGGQKEGDHRQGRTQPAISPVFAGKDMDPVMLGSWETMKGIEESVGKLTGTNRGVIDEWMFKILDNVGREPLFFAGAGWQQIIPFMERSLREMGMNESHLAEEIKRARAHCLCVTQRENIFHCDGDANNYVERSAPPAFLPDLQWDSDMAKVVREHPVVEFFRDWYVNGSSGVIWGKNGGDVVNRLKGTPGGRGIYQWAEDLKETIMKNEATAKGLEDFCEQKEPGSWNPKILKEQLEMAISYFVVEDYPRWAFWAMNKASSGSDETRAEVPWLDPDKAHLHSIKAIGKGRTGEVVVWNAENLGVNHPFLSLVRPVDLVRFKGGWDESILRPLEHAFQYLAFGKWSEDKVLTPSEVKIKDFGRWNALWSAVIGNTRGDMIDDFEDLMKGFDKMVDMDPNRKDRADFFGYIAGEIVYSKVLALTSGRRGRAFSNIARALAIEASSVPKEHQQAMQAFAGSGFSAEYGQIKEIVDRLGLNFGASPHYRTALDILITEAADPELAKSLAPIRKVLLGIMAVGNTFTGGGSQKKR